LCVLLLRNDSWASIELFEGEAEAEWVVIHTLAKLEMSEQLLHLMEHVVVYELVLVLDHVFLLAVIDAEQVVA